MHEYDRELVELRQLIEGLPQAFALLRSDLGDAAGALDEAELQRVYRAGVFRQLNQLNDKQFRGVLPDSFACKRFVGFRPYDTESDMKVLFELLEKTSGSTWEKIEQLILQGAAEHGMKMRGQKYRRWKHMGRW